MKKHPIIPRCRLAAPTRPLALSSYGVSLQQNFNGPKHAALHETRSDTNFLELRGVGDVTRSFYTLLHVAVVRRGWDALSQA